MSAPTSVYVSRTAVKRRFVVELAEAFLKAHQVGTVPIERLCRVAQVSERTLRTAFQEVCGTSPKRYMLRARLVEVHEALKRQKQTTVTQVATEHGFYELGRFASQYKATFGESPSETLRARGPEARRAC